MYKKKYSKKKKSQMVKSHSRNKIRRGNRKLKNSHRKSRKNMKGGNFHHNGLDEIESNKNDSQSGKFTIKQRNYSVEYPNGQTVVYNSPSDEFMNDYIPHDLDIPVTWRDVLTMGMIHEQKTTDQTNKMLRPDIQYNKIEIKYPYPYPLEEEV